MRVAGGGARGYPAGMNVNGIVIWCALAVDLGFMWGLHLNGVF